jgi:hypothetical protein
MAPVSDGLSEDARLRGTAVKLAAAGRFGRRHHRHDVGAARRHVHLRQQAAHAAAGERDRRLGANAPRIRQKLPAGA